MRRRVLRVVSSSSDEGDEVAVSPLPAEEGEDVEEDDQTLSNLNFHGVTLDSSNSISNPTPRNPNAFQPVPFNISDDEMDGNGSVGGAGAGNVSSEPNRSSVTRNSTSNHPCADGPISSILQGMGLRLRREWLESCIQGLERSLQGFSGLNDSTKAKLCFGQFLLADMNFCGAGCLPENVHSLNMVDLKGPFVLQVNELIQP